MELSIHETSQIISLNTIELHGIKLKFKQPFSLKYYKENGYYYYECEEFNYFGRAKHKEEMIKQFQEDLYADWMVYVENKEVQLSKQAKTLQQKLMTLLIKL